MASFLIYFAPAVPSPDHEKSLTRALTEAGFMNTIAGTNRMEYQLPPFLYHKSCSLTKDQILDRAKRIALWSRSPCAILVIECTETAWVGLQNIGRETLKTAAHRAEVQSSDAESFGEEPVADHRQASTA